jgi:predicted dehydrogenase
MRKIKWGILGGGKIANKFAADLKLIEDAELYAVASRDRSNAQAFKDLHGASTFFTSYHELVTSPDVDVIYIATPHGFHFEHTMLCLNNRKAVLCEKAFALNLKQVQEMTATARQQDVFLMEAFWSRFLPQYEKIIQLINADSIGEIRLIQADFGFRAPDPPAQRLYDPALGGGSLLDIGIYPVFLAQSLLGKPVEIQALMTSYPTAVDEQCAMILKFKNGALAVLSSSFAVDTPVEAVIAGTKARIHLKNRFHNSIATIEKVSGKEAPEHIEVLRETGYGYQFEARHVMECLRKGLKESPLMSHQNSIDLMETLDKIRQACGIKYIVDE